MSEHRVSGSPPPEDADADRVHVQAARGRARRAARLVARRTPHAVADIAREGVKNAGWRGADASVL